MQRNCRSQLHWGIDASPAEGVDGKSLSGPGRRFVGLPFPHDVVYRAVLRSPVALAVCGRIEGGMIHHDPSFLLPLFQLAI